MTPTQAVAIARARIEADPDGHGLIDRCSLTGPSFVNGGNTGDSVSMVPLASDIPCLREPAGLNDQIVVGGEAFFATDRIFMIKSSVTEAITPRYLITVTPGDGSAQLIFEKPQIIPETLSPLVTLKAVQVKQGYR